MTILGNKIEEVLVYCGDDVVARITEDVTVAKKPFRIELVSDSYKRRDENSKKETESSEVRTEDNVDKTINAVCGHILHNAIDEDTHYTVSALAKLVTARAELDRF